MNICNIDKINFTRNTATKQETAHVLPIQKIVKYMEKLMVSILAPGCTIYTDKFGTHQNFTTRDSDLVKRHKSINQKQNFFDAKDEFSHPKNRVQLEAS